MELPWVRVGQRIQSRTRSRDACLLACTDWGRVSTLSTRRTTKQEVHLFTNGKGSPLQL